MRDETINEARKRLGVSMRRLGTAGGCSAQSVLNKLRGKHPWTIAEGRGITAYLKLLDPEVSMDALFPDDGGPGDSGRLTSARLLPQKSPWGAA